ncbi:hypothetical protein D3C87_1295040 [compost metagenome]
MLIIVHHRNIHFGFQAALNFKAFGCFNIFQVYPPKSRLKGFYYFNKIINICGIQFQIKNIDISKYFKQQAFPFHDRLTGLRTNVTQA